MDQVGNLLPGLLSSIADDEAVLIVLKEIWPQIVGETLAQHTTPAQFRENRLWLEAESPEWAGAAQDARQLMRDEINRFWGKRLVEQIFVKSHLSERATELYR